MSEVTYVEVDVGGPVPCRLYPSSAAAAGAPVGSLVWAHGGAWIGGDLAMAESHWVAEQLAARGVAVLAIDYRKCVDGVAFPAPSDDVLAAWEWACSSSSSLPAPLHLGGASAGANLMAGVTKRLRDGAGSLPASLVLVYPLVHPELPEKSDELRATLSDYEGPLFGRRFTRELTVNFVGGEDGLSNPYAFAALGDVSGLPPTYILNDEFDDLRSSGEAFGALLAAAGVDVVVECEPGAPHGHLNEPSLKCATRSIDRIAGWLGRPLAALRT